MGDSGPGAGDRQGPSGSPAAMAVAARILRRCAAGLGAGARGDGERAPGAGVEDALRALATHCRAERAVLYRLAADANLLRAQDWASQRARLALPEDVPADETAALVPWLGPGDVLWAPARDGAEPLAAMASRLGAGAALLAPMHDGGELTGVVAVAADRPRGWGPDETALVRAAADALALVLAHHDAAAALGRAERRARALAEHGSELVAVLDRDGRFGHLGPALPRVLGWETSRWVGRPARELVAEPDRDVFDQRLAVVVDGGSLPEHRARVRSLRMRHADGGLRWVDGLLTNLLDDPAVGGVVLNAHDVTPRVRAEEALTYQALSDPLTGLPDRALLLDRLGQALVRAARHRAEVVVLLAGLDGFARVNDAVGHAGGDRVLVEVAERLRAAVRAADTVARFSGDQFAVVAEIDPRHDDAVDRLRTSVSEVLRRPVVVDGRACSVTASIGVARGGPETAAEELLTAAGTALREAKDGARAPGAVVDGGREHRDTNRQELVTALHRAVERGELRLDYQLITDLRTGRLWGAEALVRWTRAGVSVLAPSEFLPVAEETGLIVAVGEWVLDEALRQAVAWERAVPAAAPVGIAVNVSGRQLTDHGFVDTVARLLERTRARPGQLTVEVAERVLLEDPDGSREAFARLRDVGVRTTVDDFGAHHSSFAYLRELPADGLKVDRRYVAGVDDDPRDRAVVVGAVGIADSLGMDAQAVGVEADGQRRALAALGCRLAQGYLLHRPAPPDETVAVLAGGSGDRPERRRR